METKLYKKLLEIQRSVRSLQKDEKAQGQYDYVSGSKLLYFVRGKMDELGVLLKMEVTDGKFERIDYQTRNGAKSEMFVWLKLKFTWIDAESGELMQVPFASSGMNNWDKGLGSALTYGERYFLLKFFHIATDQDDVDALPLRGNEDGVAGEPQIDAKYIADAVNFALTAPNLSELDNIAMFYSQTLKDVREFQDAVERRKYELQTRP